MLDFDFPLPLVVVPTSTQDTMLKTHVFGKLLLVMEILEIFKNFIRILRASTGA